MPAEGGGFAIRSKGIMKKGNTLHRMYGCKVGIVIIHNRERAAYESCRGILSEPTAANYFGPDHFDTVADRNSVPTSVLTCNPKPQTSPLPEAAEGSPLSLQPVRSLSQGLGIHSSPSCDPGILSARETPVCSVKGTPRRNGFQFEGLRNFFS